MFHNLIHHRQRDGYKSHTIFKNFCGFAAVLTIWTEESFQYLQNHQDLYHSKIQLMRYLSPVQQCESEASFSM